MLASRPVTTDLLHALRNRFADRWEIDVDRSGRLAMRPRTPVGTAQPKRTVPRPGQLVDTMAVLFAGHGVPQAAPLPVRWGRDTDLTISAVQGLDPWLKDGINLTWREGFVAQPVVRFTGERDRHGRLEEGYLTSFVNVSCVQRITGPERHIDLVDTWICALSAIGIHAGRLELSGDLSVWERGPVSGITLFLTCDGVGFADAVLLWHSAKPDFMATDIGSGLERLCWLTSPKPWAETVFGASADWWDVDLLDAVRTATLLVMAGIRPGHHGSGSALRRVLRRVPRNMAAAGLGRIVRAQRAYWTAIGMAGPAWPHLTTVIENEILAAASRFGHASNASP
jgi:hypothetical protein